MSDFNNKLVIDLFQERDALKADVVRLTLKVAQLYEGTEEQRQRIKRLEDIISRASTAFFKDGSDKVVAVTMLMILDEAKEAKL